MALAHELGHYLGLDHVQPYNSECGAQLLDESDIDTENLMMPISSVSAKLSHGQISRARDMTCRYLSEWGLSSSGCVNR